MKKDISILIGNALDRFDTSLYSFLAPILGPLFFPAYDPVMQLILTYAISATSLISRPTGAFLFGMIARYYGPVVSLSYSLIGVAIATACIGCIPSYALIGWGAPGILVLVRMIRGICAAGESAIAKLYIMENKSDHHALTASHLYQSSSLLGVVVASTAASIVIGTGYHQSFMWRVCFWLGGLTGFVGCFLRYYVMDKKEEKPSTLFKAYQFSSLPLLWRNRGNIVRVAVATCFSHITYAVPFVFMNSFVPLITTIQLKTMMFLNTLLLVFDMCFIPILGRLLIHYDGKKVMIIASVVLGTTIVPLFVALPNASLLYVTCMRTWIVFWGLIFLCPLNFWFKSLFRSSENYFLVGMGNALGAATLGHMATPICLWLWYISGISYIPAVYLAVMMGFTAYAIFTAKSSSDE